MGKFKVGDRVLVTYGHGWNGYGTIAEAYGESTLIVNMEDGRRVGFNERHLEPVAVATQPQPLTITAGRHYKTRDGRKVGPMVSGRGPWFEDDRGYSYYENGKRLADVYGDEIIAEWTDEPAGAEFRVGDRVKFADDYGGPARGKEATVVKLNVWGDGKGVQVDQGGKWGISTEHAHSLRLVAPATSGKDGAEPDSRLLVAISADTSALDAEIDRVLKRLRKLKRKAKKMGIRLEYSDLREAA